MREILFRAKAINRGKGCHRTDYKNGDWVYGLITNLYDEQFENLPAQIRDINGVSGIDIDYKTIGQYTGLTDRNGKKIFEGDVVKGEFFGFPMPLKDFVFGIGWQEDVAGYKANYFGDVEVIGNIHDNPGLLGGDTK